MLAKIRTLFKSVFFKDVAISTIGQVVILLLTLIINKILSIKYGPEIYTEFNIIYKTATILAYAMILGIDALLDMGRTSMNIVGDLCGTCVVAKLENEMDPAFWTSEK